VNEYRYDLLDEVFKTGLFLEKNTFVFIIEGVKREIYRLVFLNKTQ
jgi:hypothetical protein